MAILFTDKTYRRDMLFGFVQRYFPDTDLRLWPAIGNPEDITYAITWYPEPNSLQDLPNLKAIFLTAAGVDGPLADPTLPDVPIIRGVNDFLSKGMAEYVAYHVLKFHRQFDVYEQQQINLLWKQHRQHAAIDRTIGIMGMGEMGRACIDVLQPFGFQLRGWSRTPKTIDGVTHFAGLENLPTFLNGCDIVVCVLPLTDETRGILNKDNLQYLPQGAYLIQAGRGAHMIIADIIALLDDQHLAGAALDVFETEPLPPEDPCWTHPKIILTPHIASITDYGHLCNDIKTQIANIKPADLSKD